MLSIAPVAPVAAPTIAESDVGNSPDAEAVISAADAVHPPGQLSRPAVAFGSAGFTPSGLPVGMQLVGRSFDEATLLRIGLAFQRATDFHERVPRRGMTTFADIGGLNALAPAGRRHQFGEGGKTPFRR